MKKYSTWISDDWHTSKCFFAGTLLFLIISISTGAYYLNYPQVELNADTSAYLYVVSKIMAHPYSLVDAWRLPGYPLEIVFVYMFAGVHNLTAVSAAQGALFVLTTLEVYILSILLFRNTWIAFLVGILVGTNFILVSYIKPIMSEGLALWLVVTLALVTLCYVRTMRPHFLWLITLCLVPLLFTRPEWLYLPIPLFAYLLFVTIQQKQKLVPYLRIMLLSLVIMYALVGGYITLNTLVNQYPGMTAIENFNWMGKVLQYNMEDEVLPEQQTISHQLDVCIAKIDRDPYHVLPCIPAFKPNNGLPAGQYGRSIILHHPVEFLSKSVPLFFSSLNSYYDGYPPKTYTSSILNTTVIWLKNAHIALYSFNILFPLCALLWIFLLFWKKTRSNQTVQQMGILILLVTYAVIITTLGGYALRDYMRVHITFDALIIVTIWGSFFMGIALILRRLRRGGMYKGV